MNNSAKIIDVARTLSLSHKAQSKEQFFRNIPPLFSKGIFCEGGETVCGFY